jgi:hypothetical protein
MRHGDRGLPYATREFRLSPPMGMCKLMCVHQLEIDGVWSLILWGLFDEVPFWFLGGG